MKPVDQTRFGMPEGNCFAACVATIFELPIEAVPHFMDRGDAWYPAFRAWAMENLGHEPVCFPCREDSLRTLDAPCIVSGPASRGFDHATVWQRGQLVHDPHPSRAGLLEVHDAIVFVSLFPEVRRG